MNFLSFFSDSYRKTLEKYFENTYFESLVVKQKIVQFMKCEIILWNCRDFFIQESETFFCASVESAKMKMSCLVKWNSYFLNTNFDKIEILSFLLKAQRPKIQFH